MSPPTSPALPLSAPSARWSLGRRELLLIFIFWTSLATLSVVNRLLDPRGFGFRPVSPAGPIALAYLESWIWAAATPLVFWLSSRYSARRSGWPARIAVLVLAGLVLSIVVAVLLGLARNEIFETAIPRRGAGWTPFREITRFRFLNQFVTYLAVLAAGFAREYFVRDQKRASEAAALEARAATLQAQLADARLDALRMQLNPHFLFNTLHAVSALVERDPSGVRKMIARLSELLRQTMERDAPNEVPLRDELALLRRYIEIMEIRFQGRLRVAMDLDEALLDALVPNLVLQPIVENALEHGAARAEGEGRIAIAAKREGDRLLLTVLDNGPGVSAGAPSGVGLANTRARLEQLYSDEASLTLTSAPDGGALATIALPFHTAGDLRAEGR
ncbi:MAG: histidine kinase internal region [Acidobacteria bacterium]|nr:histidine kinase internal region [Acidobacteriota bacterium]